MKIDRDCPNGLRRYRDVAAALSITASCSGCTSCEEPAARPRDAAPDVATTAGKDAGGTCRRDGPLDNVEKLPECMTPCTDAADPRIVRTSLETFAKHVLPGGPTGFTVRIKNIGSTTVPICLRADSSESLGWDRIAGVTPPTTDGGCDQLRLTFVPHTFGHRDADVDDFKVSAKVNCSRTIRILLDAGHSLTKTITWVAMRLPTPPRPWEDDAGHRFYPKDVPVHLPLGSYRVETEIPFVDAPLALRLVAASIDVAED